MSGYCNECGNTICVCGEAAAAQDVKSRDRAALEELVYYCLNSYFITASRARELLAFDEVVAPGRSIQEALDRCKIGGSILLQPGSYSESIVVKREMHVFGRGLATVTSTAPGYVIDSCAPAATSPRAMPGSAPRPGAPARPRGWHRDL